MARAFVRKSGLLILDEPTSAMDPHAEQAVIQNFKELARGCTSVLVSHRLANVTEADRIFVLEEGRLVDRELIQRGTLYAHMYEV